MRPLQHLVAFVVLLFSVLYSLPLMLRAIWWIITRLVEIVVLFVGSGSFWWFLRSYQLQKEQEHLDHMLVKLQYYTRYRVGSGNSSSGIGSNIPSRNVPDDAVSSNNSMTEAGFQLRVLKRLPIGAHLRTSWNLPPELCEELTNFIQSIGKDYVLEWFHDISSNKDFLSDVHFLLAEVLGALASRVLEIDSSQAMALVAKSLELLRLHLGWFREAYAHLAKEYPNVFDEEDENDSNLYKRQEYVTAFVQQSPFLHPGCKHLPKTTKTSAEASYLRHLATQLLTHLRPQLEHQYHTNLFVSIARNFLREITAFKILQPLTQYTQAQYANALILSCLQSFSSTKARVPNLPSASHGVNLVPTVSLYHLRSTSSFLYKATQRSGEQAEAAFQAIVEAVASAASTAATGAIDFVLESEDEIDSMNGMALGNTFFSSDRKALPSLFPLDDRLSVSKAAKFMLPTSLLAQKHPNDGHLNRRRPTHLKELKSAKVNLGSTLNSSIGKVKRRFQTFGTHHSNIEMNDVPLKSPSSIRMLRKSSVLVPKPWKRDVLEGVSTIRNEPQTLVVPSTLEIEKKPFSRGDLDEHEQVSLKTPLLGRHHVVVLQIEKAVQKYMEMYKEHLELRSSVRSRELYDLLFAVEAIWMFGLKSPVLKRLHERESLHLNGDVVHTPPMSPEGENVGFVERMSCGSFETSDVDTNVDESGVLYWDFLAIDRPGADELNRHWRFVIEECPECCASDSFVSPRGIQWILGALAKGMLGTFMAEICTHSDMLELFYDPLAVVYDCHQMDTIVRSLLQVDAYKICLDEFLVRNIKEHEATLVWPPRSWHTPVVRVLERVYEIERYVAMNGWVKGAEKSWPDLPSSEWIWEDEWTLENAHEEMGEGSDSEPLRSAWTYAKTLDDDFHCIKKQGDVIRRREWKRQRFQLPPVLTLASPPLSPQTFQLPSPVAFSNGYTRAKTVKQRFMKHEATKKETGMIAKGKMPQKKKRSTSFEKKGQLESPSMLSECEDLPPVSTKLSAYVRARATIPSLRRAVSNRSVISSMSEVQSPSTRLSGTDDLMTEYEHDDDEEEIRCFGCLKSFAFLQVRGKTCQLCHQRVCTSCLQGFAFLVYPPPLDTSKKANVCDNCYNHLVQKYRLRIEAHVGKVGNENSDLRGSSISNPLNGNSFLHQNFYNLPSPTSSNNKGDNSAPLFRQSISPLSPSGKSTLYEITVKVKEDNAYAWSVLKTFHDFVLLEENLIGKAKKQEEKWGQECQHCHWKGVDYTEMNAIYPMLRTVAIATLTYEKRLYMLEQFLQQLLACDTLCQSRSVQNFLLLANAYGTPKTATNLSTSGWENSNDHLIFPVAGTQGNATGSATLGTNGNVPVVDKSKKGRWSALDANLKETKMQVLQKIEVSLFAVLSELFEFDGIGVVRRQIFAMTRSFIKAFLGASHFRMLERQFLSFTDPKKLSGWIRHLRECVFPSDVSNEPSPSPPDLHVLRKDCLEAILASFPSKALSLFGDTACENAALKLHEFLQHEVFVKNLLFSITDEVLLHLFPDSTTYKGKKVPTSTTESVVAATTTEEGIGLAIEKHTVWQDTPPTSPS
ncbi:hypothetical protein CCR75_005299 [Bremia lactucae]|uniref:Uncharacterized protein n=1 Tax=Bremia lactucae TaxID=4779 RepID=A0A976FPY9_BRELC|nr:hypothetical protein CCR75_005299 [Bremia lactucae]